jgi:hypothetical protein
MGVGIDNPSQCRPASAGTASIASAPDIVATDMTGFQARGINDPGRTCRQQVKGLRPLPPSVLSGVDAWLPHQTLMRVTQGRIVRHARQAQPAAEHREFHEELTDTAVVSLEQWHQHQAGESWRLRTAPR